MTYNYPAQSFLSKAVLAGVFAGIAATLSNLAYDYFFRLSTEFSLSQIINVSSIIFSTMLFCTVAGVIYFFMSKMKKGQMAYIILYAVLFFLCIRWGLHVNRSADVKVSENFRELFLGILSISFLLATLFVPYLMNHQHIFLDENDPYVG